MAQTYDRSIEHWYETGHSQSTVHLIQCDDVAPNRTLQRLIRRFRNRDNLNAAAKLQAHNLSARLSATANSREVKQTLKQVTWGGEDRLNGLRKLKSLAMDSKLGQENRRSIREAGGIPILAQFAFSPENLCWDMMEACEMALGIITSSLPLENSGSLIQLDTKQLTAISWFLNRGSLQARIDAALLLASLCQEDMAIKHFVGATVGVFEGLVQLLKEDLYPRAANVALEAMVAIISGVERNAMRALEAGVIFSLSELLPEAESRGQDRPLTQLLELLVSYLQRMRRSV